MARTEMGSPLEGWQDQVIDRPASPRSAPLHAPAGTAWARGKDLLADEPRSDLAWRDGLRRRMLVFADVLSLALATGTLAVSPSEGVDAAFWAFVFLPVWILLAKAYGLYDRDSQALRHLTVDEIPTVYGWALSGTGLTAVILLLLTPVGSLHVAAAFQLWLAAGTAALVFRSLARLAWRRLTPPERAIVVGAGELAEQTRRKLELFPDIHVRVMDVLVDDTDELLRDPGLLDRVDRVMLAPEDVDRRSLNAALALCRQRGVKVAAILPVTASFGTAARLQHVADLPIVAYDTRGYARSTSLLKRALDVAAALLLMTALSPAFLVIALLVKLGGRGPVLFTQQRAGFLGRPFRMYKFRSMVRDPHAGLAPVITLADPAEPIVKMRDDPRVTPVGRVLRRTSLDELPQLVNVLKGDMSLVGPRPELVELVDRWPEEHRIRLSVKPGLTGPMQVYGRSDLTFEEWLTVEREYIENHSLWRDLRILALTVPVAITGRGAF